MQRIAFTLTFDSSPIKGEGDSFGWFVLLSPPPCGYCLKASMTAARSILPVDSRLTSGLRVKSAMTYPAAMMFY